MDFHNCVSRTVWAKDEHSVTKNAYLKIRYLYVNPFSIQIHRSSPYTNIKQNGDTQTANRNFWSAGRNKGKEKEEEIAYIHTEYRNFIVYE